MDRFRVVGGARLSGRVVVPGAKNASLKLMAAALLAEGTTTIENVPPIHDVSIMAELLRRLGCVVVRDTDAAALTIAVPAEPGHRADYDLVRAMRASISVLGPLLARRGEVDVAMPGGDAIGSRGLDLHVAGLTRMGAQVHLDHGFLVAQAPEGLRGVPVRLEFPSVGATETLLMAAATATGTTEIDNAAREPEIVDLCLMLGSMGATIHGAGTSTLTVEGVDRLHPTSHRVVADRIVAGSWAFAAAITGGDVIIEQARADHLATVLDKVRAAGAQVDEVPGGIRVWRTAELRAVDVATLPYPGFPTDLQPFVVALDAVATGQAMITENLFESRFRFVAEIARLGADVRVDGHHALVRGGAALSGAPVEATDIRAGAALVIAGLVADGVTTVSGVHHIDRGYAAYEESLQGLGADVRREPDVEMPLDL